MKDSIILNFILMAGHGQPTVVGEIKTPCIGLRQIPRKTCKALLYQAGTHFELCKLLGDFSNTCNLYSRTDTYPGQIAKYTHDMDLKYGVMTTYNEKLDLRQFVDDGMRKLDPQTRIPSTTLLGPTL